MLRTVEIGFAFHGASTSRANDGGGKVERRRETRVESRESRKGGAVFFCNSIEPDTTSVSLLMTRIGEEGVMGGTEPVPSGIYDGAVFCQRSAMGSKNFQFSATGVGLGALGSIRKRLGGWFL